MRTVYIFILLSIVFLACDKEDNEERSFLNLGEIATCHNDQMWDSASLFQAVLGEWEWEQQYFAWTAEIDDEEFDDLELDFRSDGTVEVEWDDTTEIVNWRIEDISVIVEQGQRYHPAHGWFYLCDDEMMFANSPVDGNDHTFTSADWTTDRKLSLKQ